MLNKGWVKESDKLTVEMEEFARNFNCLICSEFYCKHMLAARAMKFKDRMDKELEALLKL